MFGERKTIWIKDVSDEDQKKCLSCSAQGAGHESPYRLFPTIPYCRIAKLQKELKKKPRLGQIAEKQISVNLVPKDCPNGY